MIKFFTGSGASDFEVGGLSLSEENWERIRGAAIRLLQDRGYSESASLLDEIPFQLHEGTNYFQDEFNVLYCAVPHDRYVELSALAGESEKRSSFRAVVKVLEEIGHHVRHIAVGLDTKSSPTPVRRPRPEGSSATVERALDDADRLINSGGGATSAVDRVHTALHGFLKDICREAGIAFVDDAPITQLFGLLRQSHPAFSDNKLANGEPLHKVLRPMAGIIDALNPLRNERSLAHPNAELLEEPEAMLVINASRTLLHYIDSRVSVVRKRGPKGDLPF